MSVKNRGEQRKRVRISGRAGQIECIFRRDFNETPIRISVKTRIGKESPEEWIRLLEIYNQYPMEELIIHPRIQTDFYKNTPNLEMFEYAVKNSKNPLCYNGDICTKREYETICNRFPRCHL